MSSPDPMFARDSASPSASLPTGYRVAACASAVASTIVWAFAGGAACTSSGGHARDQRQLVTALAEARDAVCGCADLACAEAAERRLSDFLLRHVDRFKKIPVSARGTADAVASEATRLDGELRACKRRLEEAARAS